MDARQVINQMQSLRDEQQRLHLMRFFKTDKGQYGEGDEFLGLRVPLTRAIAKQHARLDLNQVVELLHNRYHEIRLCGLLILVDRFERDTRHRLRNDPDAIRRRDHIVSLYLNNAHHANNWDLVDLSVYKILGRWLLLPTFLGSADPDEAADNHDHKIHTLDTLADDPCLWLQRMSIVATWTPTHHGDPSYCLRYAKRLLNHPHDLIQKAVGWMLREMGKCCGAEVLRDFLRQYAARMPRTALRYAIERFDTNERAQWIKYQPS